MAILHCFTAHFKVVKAVDLLFHRFSWLIELFYTFLMTLYIHFTVSTAVKELKVYQLWIFDIKFTEFTIFSEKQKM